MIKPKSHRKLALPIDTARLRLRDFVKSDFAAICSYSSDPRVTKFLFFGARDEDSAAEYLDGLLASQSEEPRDRKSTRLNSSHTIQSRMPSSA